MRTSTMYDKFLRQTLTCSNVRNDRHLQYSKCSNDRLPASKFSCGRPPALPCLRDDTLVSNGAAAPNSCLSLLEMQPPTVVGGLLPAGKASTTRRISFYQPRLRFCPTKETNSERTSTQYALYFSISGGASFLPPPGKGLCKQNQGKLWYLIQGVLQVVYAPARFWERGARYFVGMLSCWSGWW